MKSPKQFWNKHAARYAKAKIRDEESYQKKLAKTQEYFKPEWQVLEFGCGTGSTAIIHAPYVQHILATDVSDKMLEIAQQKTRDAGITNISYQEGSLDALELQPESFDAVLGLNILHLLEDVESAIARVHSVLRPGGIFVSSTGLLNELKWYFRMLIPVAQLLGVAPPLTWFERSELVSMMARAGFLIEYEWQPERGSVFIVARKLG